MNFRPAENPWGLTAQQTEVMDTLLWAVSHKAVSRHMGIEVKTIATHLARAKEKIGVASVLHAAIAWDRWRQAEAKNVLVSATDASMDKAQMRNAIVKLRVQLGAAEAKLRDISAVLAPQGVQA